MKKIAIACFALAVLSGCTIIDDKDLEKIPSKSVLKSIKIRYQYGEDDVLSGTVLQEGNPTNKVTINWQGTMDVFWFRDRLSSTEYLLSNGKVARINYKAGSGTVFSEEFFYNQNGTLDKVDRKSATTTSSFKFYYKGNKVDSVAQVVTEPGKSAITGFHLMTTPLNNNNQVDLKAFISVFPYNSSITYPANALDRQDIPHQEPATNFFNSSYHEFTIPNDGSNYEFASSEVKVAVDEIAYNSFYSYINNSVYEYNVHGNPQTTVYSNHIDVQTGSSTGAYMATNIVSPFQLIPGLVTDSQLLGRLFFRDDVIASLAAGNHNAHDLLIEYGFEYFK